MEATAAALARQARLLLGYFGNGFCSLITDGDCEILEVARQGMDLLDVDELGLEKLDRAMLETMIDKFAGGPVGLETLSAMTGEDASTIEDVYEPYLMQLGFLTRTPRGRCVTALAYDHLHIPYEVQSQFSI